MAGPLKLEVILSMVDKAMAPLRGVDRQSKALAASLKQSREALRALERQQQQVEGIQKQQAGLDRQSRALKDLSTRLDAVRAAQGSGSAQARRLAADLDRQTAAYDRQRTTLDALQAAARQAGIGNLSAAQRRLRADIDATNARIAAQRGQLDALAAVRDRRGQALARTAVMGATGAAAVVASRAVARPVQRTLGAYSDQENAATQLKASGMLADGTVPAELQRIDELAVRLGDRLPGTTADFLEMMTMLKRQGLSAQSILGGTGEAAALLGVQLRMPVTAAAEFAAKMQDATQSTESEMLGLMDVIQRTYYLGVESGDMLQGFSKMSPVLGILKQKGLDAANTLAPLLVMMDQTGMRGESAGNAIRKMFQAGLDAKKVAGANKILAKAGAGFKLDFTDKAGNFAGLDNLFAQLEKIKGIQSDTRRTSLIKELFGDDAENLQVVNTIMDKGRAGYEETVAKLAAQADLRKRVDVQLGTLSNVVEAAQGSAINVLASIGETIAGDAKGIVRWLGETAAAIGAWVREHPTLTAHIVRVTAVLAGLLVAFGVLRIALAAVLGPFAMARAAVSLLRLQMCGARTAGQGLGASLLGMAGNARTGLSGMAGGIGAMGSALASAGRLALASPLGLAIMAIALLALVVVRYWEPIKAFFTGLWQGFVDGLAPLRPMFATVFGAIGAALEPLRPLWDWLAGAFAAVWGWVVRLVGPFEASRQSIDGATQAGRGFGAWLAGLLVTLADLVGRFFAFGADIIGGLVDGIASGIARVREVVSRIGSAITGTFKGDLQIRSPSRVFIEAGANIGQGAAIGIGGTADLVRQAALGMATAATVALPAIAAPAWNPAATPTAPLAAPAGRGATTLQGDTIHLTIQAPAGVDAQAIARLVGAELDRRDRAKAARLRGAFVDYGN